MNGQLSGDTVKQVLPYKYRVSIGGWIAICRLDGKEVIYHVSEIQTILENENLIDVHLRKMYQGAVDYWKENS